MRVSDFGALIFDSDGVLVDSETIHVAAEIELLAEIGLSYDHVNYLSRFVGLSNSDFRSELEKDYAAKFGEPFPCDFAERLEARVWPRIEAELEPIPGVGALVEAFGGPVAVASSAPIAKLEAKLAIAGLADLFGPHIYSVEHVAAGKPAPDLFLHAAQALGVSPTKCAVIEDSVNGVKAAHAARMMAIGFVGGGHADAGLADRLRAAGASIVVSTHDEIRALL